jgi:cellulose synthase (UDP-forming)
MIDLFSLAPILFVIGVAVTVLPLLDRDSTAGRLLPCLGCLALIIRTIHWRLTETLPPFSFGFPELFAYLFAAFETVSGIGSIFLFLFLSRTVDRRPETFRWQSWVAAKRPSVDVLIPTYNEDEAILDQTILGALSQNYGNFRVFVLDDGGREGLRELCGRRGVGYITRPDNAHAKAGNMNHALTFLRANGGLSEFIAILDADFVAQPNFLARALALFHDDHVGCVQTPQHFYNPDPLQHGFRAGKRWPDDQRFFFDVLLASKDAWGVAFSCGTSSITRLSALEAIGGFPVESVTEDMLLSVKLKTRGWHTVYLNERLSMGLAPEGLAEYVTQRRRWCLGFMQIARSAWGPLTREKLPLIDRFSLIDTFLYWGTYFPFRLACLFAPCVSAFDGAPIIYADTWRVISHSGVSLLWFWIVLAWLSRGRSLPILADAGQVLIIPAAMRATFAGLLHPEGHKFKVTAKGGDRTHRRIQWRIILCLSIPLGLTIAGVLYGIGEQFGQHPLNQGGFVWLFWSYYNVVVLAVAMLAAVELPRRREERFATDEWALVGQGGRYARVQLSEISVDGATARGPAPAAPGALLSLVIEGLGGVEARVARAAKKEFELSFNLPRAQHDALLLKLFSGHYGAAGPEKTVFSDVLVTVALRMVR